MSNGEERNNEGTRGRNLGDKQLRQQVQELEESVDALQDSAEEISEALEDQDEADRVPPTIVEWGARAVSLLLLALLIGYTVRMALQPREPPHFEYEVRTEQIEERDGSWVVPIEVRNLSNAGVIELTVVAELVDENDIVVDEADLPLPLFGPGESIDVEVWFDENPADYELQFNVDGYITP